MVNLTHSTIPRQRNKALLIEFDSQLGHFTTGKWLEMEKHIAKQCATNFHGNGSFCYIYGASDLEISHEKGGGVSQMLFNLHGIIMLQMSHMTHGPIEEFVPVSEITNLHCFL